MTPPAECRVYEHFAAFRRDTTKHSLPLVLAYRYASAVKVGPFVYTVIAFTALIDWFLWNQAPTLGVVLGIALVIGCVITAIRKQATSVPVRETVKDDDPPVKKPLRLVPTP